MITTDSLLDLPGINQAPSAVLAARTERAPERLWLLDLSQIWGATCWLYFGYVLDCHTGRCVGFAPHRVPHAELLSRALQMAVAEREPCDPDDDPPPGVAVVFGRRCHLAGLQHQPWALPSASNLALAESFLADIRRNLVDDVEWMTEAHAQAALGGWIVDHYNPGSAARRFPPANGNGSGSGAANGRRPAFAAS
jgi:transposase InsO family protein